MGWGRSCRYLRRPSHRTGSSNWSRSDEGGSEVQNNRDTGLNTKTASCTVKSLITASCVICKTSSCIGRLWMLCSLHKPWHFLFLLKTMYTHTHTHWRIFFGHLASHLCLSLPLTSVVFSVSISGFLFSVFGSLTQLLGCSSCRVIKWWLKKGYLPQSKYCLTSSPPPAVNVRYKVGLSRPANYQWNISHYTYWLTNCLKKDSQCDLKFPWSSSPFLSMASSSLANMGGVVSGGENCSVKSSRQKPGGDNNRLSTKVIFKGSKKRILLVLHWVNAMSCDAFSDTWWRC